MGQRCMRWVSAARTGRALVEFDDKIRSANGKVCNGRPMWHPVMSTSQLDCDKHGDIHHRAARQTTHVRVTPGLHCFRVHSSKPPVGCRSTNFSSNYTSAEHGCVGPCQVALIREVHPRIPTLVQCVPCVRYVPECYRTESRNPCTTRRRWRLNHVCTQGWLEARKHGSLKNPEK